MQQQSTKCPELSGKFKPASGSAAQSAWKTAVSTAKEHHTDSTTLSKRKSFKENERAYTGIISSLSLPPIKSVKTPRKCLPILTVKN